MCKSLEINTIKIFYFLPLLTLNATVQNGQYAPKSTCNPGWKRLT